MALRHTRKHKTSLLACFTWAGVEDAGRKARIGDSGNLTMSHRHRRKPSTAQEFLANRLHIIFQKLPHFRSKFYISFVTTSIGPMDYRAIPKQQPDKSQRGSHLPFPAFYPHPATCCCPYNLYRPTEECKQNSRQRSDPGLSFSHIKDPHRSCAWMMHGFYHTSSASPDSEVHYLNLRC